MPRAGAPEGAPLAQALSVRAPLAVHLFVPRTLTVSRVLVSTQLRALGPKFVLTGAAAMLSEAATFPIGAQSTLRMATTAPGLVLARPRVLHCQRCWPCAPDAPLRTCDMRQT
jgi:hypothetical protein